MKTLLTAAVLLCAARVGASGARIEIMEGNPASPLKVFIYEDLQCSDCTRLRALMDERILPRYGTRVAFIHRDFPLGKHDWARPAAIAGRWVFEQSTELGLTFRHQLMDEQNNITAPKLNAWLVEFADRNHLDRKGIIAALTDPRLVALVDQDRQSGAARGVTKTPTVFVGGVSFVEIIVFEDLAQAIDDALAK